MNKLLKIGWIELVVALLMGALVRLKSGRVIQIRPWFRQTFRKALDPSIFGFDFSKWQGFINFAQVAVYGAKFIILRCAYGITRDERFAEYIAECLKYFPKHTSAYHYYDPRYHPVAQADEVIEILLPYKDKIRRVYGDFEFTWSGTYESSANWKIFAVRIIEAGFEFGVYTRKTWWDSRVGSLASWFGQFPLWAAQYSTSLTMIPLGWTKADIWQQGTPSIGHDVGTESLEVDYNIMDDEFYQTEYDGEPIPPPGGDMYYELKPVGNYNVSVRDTHPDSHIQGTYLGRISNGSTGKALEKYEYPADKYVSGVLRAKQGDIWWKVYEADGSAINGWSAQKHLGVTYLSVTQIGTPPPTTTLPTSVESTDVWKDENGNVIATYKGTLTRQA